MIKFDDFTNNNLKIFINRNKNINFNYIKELKKDIVKNFNKNIKYEILEYKIPDNKLKKLFDTEWVYSKIYDNLDNLDVECEIIWDYKTKHTIYLKCNKEKFTSFKQRLPILLNILNFLYDKKNTNQTRPINIYLILSHLKKELEKDVIINAKHINSGYTDFNSNEILVWREEEFEKVIFHEMIHYMDLDVRNMSFDDNHLPHEIDGYKSYFEAFTDFWGILYHLIYISIITKKSVNSLLQIEYNFIENQANLLNHHFGLKNWKDKKKIKQNSPAFTYFILKYLLFKEIIYSNNIQTLEYPKELIMTILKKKFIQKVFIDLNSARMSLLQLY